MFQSLEIYFLRTQSNIALQNVFLIGFVDNPRISKAHSKSKWFEFYFCVQLDIMSVSDSSLTNTTPLLARVPVRLEQKAFSRKAI